MLSLHEILFMTIGRAIFSILISDLFFISGSNACSQLNGNCSQLCLPTSPTTRTCNCTAGFLLDPLGNTACVPLNSTLLFSTGSLIHGIALDPTQPEELLPRISRISMATALDFDAGNILEKSLSKNWPINQSNDH